MPRRQKRFSFLERALKAAGGTASGGVLVEFANFKAGINKANTGTVDPTARKAFGYALLPFGADKPTATPTPVMYYKTRISEMSNAWRIAHFTNADLGYEAGDTYAGATSSGGFYPAVAKIFIPSAAAVAAVSGITKRSYQKKVGKAYSVPFGAHGADAARSNEFEQQAAITAKVGTIASTPATGKSVSFVPEQMVKVRAEPTAGA